MLQGQRGLRGGRHLCLSRANVVQRLALTLALCLALTVAPALAIDATSHESTGTTAAGEALFARMKACRTAAERADEVLRIANLCQEKTEGTGHCPLVVELAMAAADIHYAGDLEEARAPYERVLQMLPKSTQVHAVVLNNLGRLVSDLGDQDTAMERFESCRQMYEFEEGVSWLRELHAHLWNNIGLAHHRRGREHDDLAKVAFERSLTLDPLLEDGEAWFNLGVVSKNLGLHDIAFRAYERSLEVNPTNVAPLINLAALFHEHQSLDVAAMRYQQVISVSPPGSDIRRMALINLGTVYTELGDATRAVTTYLRALEEANEDVRDEIDLSVRCSVAVTQRIGCNWSDFDRDTAWLEQNVDRRELQHGEDPSCLPFDTLLREYSWEFRRRVAEVHAAQFGPPGNRPELAKTGERVRVGYFSYDFNDHPTAHLCEDLFDLHALHRRVDSFTLNFGKDDGSDFRKRIEHAGAGFRDLSLLSHSESVRVIRDELRIEILMDMQGFTRGGRPEIVVARPAPIIVNYLVFAGTSGAAFVDYFIGDRIASPLAELAPHFSEKLVLMPHSYQVNTYTKTLGPEGVPGILGQTEWGDYCERFDELDGSNFVFANFNKNDKHEPLSFETWMQVLRRTPGSVLWLLEPPRRLAPGQTRENLIQQARARGVDASRLRFARRAPKAEHVARHGCADIFLDTLVYGAHSTATDALRGGLPVLTVAGSAFASRVAASLLSAHGVADMLVAHSVKDFIDTAVDLYQRPDLVKALKQQVLAKSETSSPLFDVDTYTVHLERAFRAMVDLRLMNRVNHILVRAGGT
ncbi:UDP-N-acetylglucosamine--peptide N-acetylglucosaminyltransferase 110 kDa subunit [Hondaea fermentalgiana]|uniref:protein O-GlcNAc transferase n=1 Tax=Hondaea fermentalgiana TaxID=2315210 RepID=A0A2R5GD53_9STRA|nr:UDP-N-acetylglucosamine--peptide N-acetylglucosaminyltransferase 110 kDa subunit [Hondaea fermentalgiana]|eukprot:GBG26091.1 UDP-N-acetylglucosamine--peptide N-acetylglucosaminyltransferase 110 kDa subunit [Hondaea fermentalgiana]